MKNLVVLVGFLVGFSASSWAFDIPPLDGPIELLERPNTTGHSDFIQAFTTAKKSIDMTMFRITDSKVADALGDAAQRGVQVRIILDGIGLQAVFNKKIADQMTAKGVQIRGSSSFFSISHSKAMVVDNKKAFITTINLTRSSANSLDLGVVTTDRSVIDEMDRVFEGDWKNATTQEGTTPLLHDPNLVWSPNSSHERLVPLIQSAQKTLDLTVENIGDPQIQEALKQAANKKIKIRLLIPMCGYTEDPIRNYRFARDLIAVGADVRVMPIPYTAKTPFVHLKMIVADQAMIYIGSINFSFNSMERARELGILFSDRKVATRIQDLYERDWKVAVEIPAQNPNCPVIHNMIGTSEEP